MDKGEKYCFFFNLEKINYEKKLIRKLQPSDVYINENPVQILKHTKHVYEELYKIRPIATTKGIENHCFQ